MGVIQAQAKVMETEHLARRVGRIEERAWRFLEHGSSGWRMPP
jgi:hypothetical protein